jgi:hypothetical protein
MTHLAVRIRRPGILRQCPVKLPADRERQHPA